MSYFFKAQEEANKIASINVWKSLKWNVVQQNIYALDLSVSGCFQFE